QRNLFCAHPEHRLAERLLPRLPVRSRCRERVTGRRWHAESPVVARFGPLRNVPPEPKTQGKWRCEMTLSNRALPARVGPTLPLAGSLAAAETTSQTTPQIGQQRSETHSQSSDQINRMVEHRTGMMANWSQ